MVWQPPRFLSQTCEITLTVHNDSQIALACSLSLTRNGRNYKSQVTDNLDGSVEIPVMTFQ